MTARNGSVSARLAARLTALEARAGIRPAPPTMPPERQFLIYALAVLAGGAIGDEPPMVGFARALGYPLTFLFFDALKDSLHGKGGGPDGFNARWSRAAHGLYRDIGLDPAKPDSLDLVLTAEPLIRAARESRARSQALAMLDKGENCGEGADHG
jgi:hypothetical protein